MLNSARFTFPSSLYKKARAASSDSLATRALFVPLRQLNELDSCPESPGVSPDDCSNKFLPKSKNRSTAIKKEDTGSFVLTDLYFVYGLRSRKLIMILHSLRDHTPRTAKLKRSKGVMRLPWTNFRATMQIAKGTLIVQGQTINVKIEYTTPLLTFTIFHQRG